MYMNRNPPRKEVNLSKAIKMIKYGNSASNAI
jgi:hypothetical protein